MARTTKKAIKKVTKKAKKDLYITGIISNNETFLHIITPGDEVEDSIEKAVTLIPPEDLGSEGAYVYKLVPVAKIQPSQIKITLLNESGMD